MSKPLFSKATAKRIKAAILAYGAWYDATDLQSKLVWARIIRDEKQIFAECGIDVSHILREIDAQFHHEGGNA